MLKYKNTFKTFFFSLLLTLISCAPNITLKVTVDEDCFPSDSSKLKIFLLDEKCNQELTEIISSNEEYMRVISYRISDSIRTLQRFYNTAERNFKVLRTYTFEINELMIFELSNRG